MPYLTSPGFYCNLEETGRLHPLFDDRHQDVIYQGILLLFTPVTHVSSITMQSPTYCARASRNKFHIVTYNTKASLISLTIGHYYIRFLIVPNHLSQIIITGPNPCITYVISITISCNLYLCLIFSVNGNLNCTTYGNLNCTTPL